jgi:RNA polymerase sigma-70 factor (ECF subfamily)
MTEAERDTPHSLLLRLAHGQRDEQAWAEFAQRYRPRIAAWCRGRGLQSADADDVTQTVLQQLLDAMREFHYDPARSFRAWLRTVTVRACSRYRVAETRAAGLKDDEALRRIEEMPARQDLARRIAEVFDEDVLRQATEAVQARVEFSTWEAYRLQALEGLSGADAAARLGMTVMNVYVARRRVQKMLQLEVERLEQSAGGQGDGRNKT